MSKTPYLDFYKKYYGKRMPEDGLCNSLCYDPNVELFRPSEKEQRALISIGQSDIYWGSEASAKDVDDRMYTFTPLRQTIVLFCAAINGEL